MKNAAHYTCLTLSILCLITTGVWMYLASVSQSKLTLVQQQQNILRQHQFLQQVTSSVVQQLAQVSQKNDNIRQFLTRHDITVTSTTNR